jgi:hypothetical protein
MMPRMHFTATSASAAEASRHQTARSTRLRAFATDLGVGLGIQLGFGVLGLLVFLVSTRGGDRDLSSSAASIGWAIALAAVPAWLAYLGHASAVEGGTPGQTSAGLGLQGSPARRLARLAMHPVGAIGWCWLALVAAWATAPGLPLMLAAVAVTVLGGGVVSMALLARDPNAPALHDRLAGTRLVTR